MRIPGTYGGTFLHVAAKRNRAGLCHWLLRFGADVNGTDIRDMTPLHHAAFHGAADAARLLIERGADLGAKDWRGRSPLDLAEAGNGEALARTIREEISLRHGQRAQGVKVLRDRKRKGDAQE
jgi:ankyrin repeat protein